MANLRGASEPLAKPRGKGTYSLLPITGHVNLLVHLARFFPRGVR
jgi:hypothetical protein